jgi:hypothetical protein
MFLCSNPVAPNASGQCLEAFVTSILSNDLGIAKSSDPSSIYSEVCHPLISLSREQDPIMSSRSCNEIGFARTGYEGFSYRHVAERVDADLTQWIDLVPVT